MKNILDVIKEFTDFIVGPETTEAGVLEKARIGFATEPVRKKRKYTKRTKK